MTDEERVQKEFDAWYRRTHGSFYDNHPVLSWVLMLAWTAFALPPGIMLAMRAWGGQ
jgi:hypothetical protein